MKERHRRSPHSPSPGPVSPGLYHPVSPVSPNSSFPNGGFGRFPDHGKIDQFDQADFFKPLKTFPIFVLLSSNDPNSAWVVGKSSTLFSHPKAEFGPTQLQDLSVTDCIRSSFEGSAHFRCQFCGLSGSHFIFFRELRLFPDHPLRPLLGFSVDTSFSI